jgi:hypothetical protein
MLRPANHAARRLGELISAQKATVGLATGREGKRKSLGLPENPSDRPTLAEAGIDKNGFAGRGCSPTSTYEGWHSTIAANRVAANTQTKISTHWSRVIRGSIEKGPTIRAREAVVGPGQSAIG